MTASTWRRRGAGVWRHPVALVALTEMGYLFYFNVVDSVPHTVGLFSWMPLGSWRLHGPAVAAAACAACFVALFLVYGALLAELSRRRESSRDRLAVFLGAAVFSLTLIFLPRLLSKDLFDYMAHARVLTAHHANPFSTPAGGFPPDDFTRAMGWPAATPLYGPAWVSMIALLSLIAGGGFFGSVLVYKLFFAATHLACGWLVQEVASGFDGVVPGAPRPLRAAAFYLWNPLVLTQVAGDAHNDGVVLFWLLLGVWMIQRGDDLLGGACAALSVMIKYLTAPVVLLLAIQRWRERGAGRAAMFAGVCAAVAAVSYAPYLEGFSVTHFLRPYEHSSYQGGLMMMVEMATGRLVRGANTPGSPLATMLLAISLALAAGLAGWYVRLCLRTRTLMDALENGALLLLVYLLFVTALLRTSYLVWLVGLAAVATSVRLRRAVAIFSCTVLALEVVWVWRILLPQPAPSQSLQRFAASAVAVGVPILYLLLHSRGWTMARWVRPRPDDEAAA